MPSIYIIFPILGAILGATIGVLQRKGVRGDKFSIKRLLKSKTWWAGYLLGFLGVYFGAISLNNLDVSIIVPIANLGIPLMLIFSYIFLGEKINRYEFVGIILLIISAIVLGLA